MDNKDDYEASRSLASYVPPVSVSESHTSAIAPDTIFAKPLPVTFRNQTPDQRPVGQYQFQSFNESSYSRNNPTQHAFPDYAAFSTGLSPVPSSLPPPTSRTPRSRSRQFEGNVMSSTEPSSGPPATVTAAPVVAKPRPIRFIHSNEGQPHVKRRRITAACRTCRKRKTRCSGEKPVCDTCRQHNQECLGYAVIPPQKGKATAASEASASSQRNDEDDDEIEPEDLTSPTDSLGGESQDGGSAYVPQMLSPMDAALRRNDSGGSSSYHSQTSDSLNMRISGNELDSRSTPSSKGPSPFPRSQISAVASSSAHRVPYFRWFGATAIAPGLKEMVGKVQDEPRRSSAASLEPRSQSTESLTDSGNTGPPQADLTSDPPLNIPFYEPLKSTAIPLLVTGLVDQFFTHLGGNYPFLQRERFERDLSDQRVDGILVDVICALAVRFTEDSWLKTTHPTSVGKLSAGESLKSLYGEFYCQRAKSAVPSRFSCPTVAVVQACLLLAYEEFGGDRDSSLWMYLGIAIRMAQDLGMHKSEGLQLEGRTGPTPRSARSSDVDISAISIANVNFEKTTTASEAVELTAQRLAERERIDTFYSLYFLDRMISSGTGRPVTLRDKSIEIAFPPQDEVNDEGWPSPFPALIRVISLYGRVTDLLNNVKESNSVNGTTLKRLAGMETDLTSIFHKIPPSLQFNVVNFRQYAKIGQGTTFNLLHFVFHTCIILIHRPTLLHTPRRQVQQLFANSHELSMSSAKTIADILSFAELIDAGSVIGNPFAAQTIHIAACAFLQEAFMQGVSSLPRSTIAPSRSESLSPTAYRPRARAQSQMTLKTQSTASKRNSESLENVRSGISGSPGEGANPLANAATQNFQQCYKGLKALESRWAGMKYIVGVLDQKAKGIIDTSLFTSADTNKTPTTTKPESSFAMPGWRRQVFLSQLGDGSQSSSPSLQEYLGRPSNVERGFLRSDFLSPQSPASQAIAWSLSGLTDSPSSNLTFIYPPMTASLSQPTSAVPSFESTTAEFPAHESSGLHAGPSSRRNTNPQPIIATRSGSASQHISFTPPQSALPQQHLDPSHFDPMVNYDPTSNAMLMTTSGATDPAMLTVPSPFPIQQSPFPIAHQPQEAVQTSDVPYATPSSLASLSPSLAQQAPQQQMGLYSPVAAPPLAISPGDMMVESQDIDMSGLTEHIANAPWYLPQDMLGLFGTDTALQGAQDQEIPDPLAHSHPDLAPHIPRTSGSN